MIRHITFASDDMSISGQKCCESALKHGCDDSTCFDGSFYTNEFYEFNKEILDQKRGAGYWLWKPYFIFHELLIMNENDILVYTDAGLLFENNINHLIKVMDQDIMLFDNRWIHGDWCKMDVLLAMRCNKPEIIQHTQLQASCIILKNKHISREFIKTWLRWCQLPGMIDDSPSIHPNLPGFREHRHDQAILTNLALQDFKGYNPLKFHWWPVQYCLKYKHKYSDNYPQIFLHHRKRNNEW